MIYSFYIFGRNGACLYYEDWNRRTAPKSMLEEQKLMFGLLYSLRSFCTKISPKPCTSFSYFKTSLYKLHLFETATGLKFILLTDVSAPTHRDELSRIYKDIYVEYVVKNPAHKVGEPITVDGFISKLAEYVKKLPSFSSPAPASASAQA